MRYTLVLLLFFIGSPVVAQTPDITVCPSGCDYASLDAALDSINAGDDVLIHVFAGTYDDGTFRVAGQQGATVSIVGVDGPEATILTQVGENRVVFVGNGDVIRLEGVSITGGHPTNTSNEGAGVKVASGGELELIDCIISDNQTTNDGAGVYVADGGVALVEGCTFERNIINGSTGYSHGGGLALTSIDGTTVNRCRFIENHATGYGGGLYAGRLNQARDVIEPYAQVANCLFVANTADFNGGGAYVEPALFGCKDPVVIGYVTNCTFVQNDSPRAGAIWGNNKSWCGGSLGLDSPSIVVVNSIIWGNGPEYVNTMPVEWVRCCIDYLSADMASALGCINLDPRFMGYDGPDVPEEWNYRLLPGSPCTNVGTSLVLGSSVDYGPLDLDGLPRVGYGNPPPNRGEAIVDIGATEYAFETVGDGFAFWQGMGRTTDLGDPSNWYEGRLPGPTATWLLDGEIEVTHQGTVVLGLTAIFSGVVTFDPAATGTVKFEETGKQAGLYVGVGGQPANLRLAEALTLEVTHLQCERGRLYLEGGKIKASSKVFLQQVDPTSQAPGAGGVRIGTLHGPGVVRRRNDTSSPEDPIDPVLVNDGRIRVDGLIEVFGDFAQDGGTLKFQHRPTDGFGQDRRVVISGKAALGGAVIFDVAANTWDPPVGASYPILQAGEGFVAGQEAFDFVVNQWYGSPKFMVLSTVNDVIGGSSIMATVVTIDALVSADPALESVGLELRDMLLVDVDGDEREDLILSVSTGEDSNGQVVVLLNLGTDGSGSWNGLESYSAAFAVTVGREPFGLDAGFFDVGSAQPGANYDLVVANEGDGTVSVIQNDSVEGTVVLTVAQTIDVDSANFENTRPTDVCALDLDLDPAGLSDLVVCCQSGVVWTYENLTTFTGFGGMGNEEENSADSTIAQFTPGLGGGGGVRDTGPTGRSRTGSTVESGGVVGLGGSTQIIWTTSALPPGSAPADIAQGDLDDDGFMDVVTVNHDDASLSILLGSGVGTYELPVTISLDVGYDNPVSVAIGDLDGDGDLDLMVICEGPDVDPSVGRERVGRVLRNTLSDGSFGWVFAVEELLRGEAPYMVRAGNMDDDGVDDAIVLTAATTSFAGDPTFGFGTMVLDDTGSTCLGDIDGNGQVSGGDMGLLLAQWGPCSGRCTADLTGNGTVDGADIGLLLAAWGPCGDPGT